MEWRFSPVVCDVTPLLFSLRMSKLNAKQMRSSVEIPTILNPCVLCTAPVVLSSRSPRMVGREHVRRVDPTRDPNDCQLSKAPWMDLRTWLASCYIGSCHVGVSKRFSCSINLVVIVSIAWVGAVQEKTITDFLWLSLLLGHISITIRWISDNKTNHAIPG